MTVQKKRGRPRKDPMVAAVQAPKKRGRPAGTRVKKVPTVESVHNQWQQRYYEMVAYYEEIMNNVQNNSKAISTKIANLEHQAIGYRSVISYLESKIEQLIANSVRGN